MGTQFKPFPIDHDLHIHTRLSFCSKDPEQTPERILRYAKENGFRQISVTDHFWDEKVEGMERTWYHGQDFAHVSEALPLPQAEGIRFCFGCETEIDKDLRIGISPERYDAFDFIIVPTTHLHMKGVTIREEDDPLPRRVSLYVRRFETLLRADLPFRKVGVAHLTCPLVTGKSAWDHVDLLNGISDGVFRDLFRETAKLGVGVELNFDFFAYEGARLDAVLRPYRIALECGCKFYFGSDAHHPKKFEKSPANFRATAEALGLTENDRFDPFV